MPGFFFFLKHTRTLSLHTSCTLTGHFMSHTNHIRQFVCRQSLIYCYGRLHDYSPQWKGIINTYYCWHQDPCFSETWVVNHKDFHVCIPDSYYSQYCSYWTYFPHNTVWLYSQYPAVEFDIMCLVPLKVSVKLLCDLLLKCDTNQIKTEVLFW